MQGILHLYYWLKIVWLSAKCMFRINLGDKVTLLSDNWPQTYTVINGVCSGTWKVTDGIEDAFEVKREQCRKIITIQNYIGSFRFRYSFYMSCWFDIWCRNGIEPWVKKCNIW